ncbi:hypothetical protein V8C37DRAFT_399786 [Trichoderma ceciliae]
MTTYEYANANANGYAPALRAGVKTYFLFVLVTLGLNVMLEVIWARHTTGEN